MNYGYVVRLTALASVIALDQCMLLSGEPFDQFDSRPPCMHHDGACVYIGSQSI